MNRYVAESITADAGRFGHVGLVNCLQNVIVIDSAMYLLTISLPVKCGGLDILLKTVKFITVCTYIYSIY